MSKKARGNFLLLLTAVIWGAAFVAQSEGMKYVGPFTLQASRFFLAGAVLLPVIAVCDRKGLTPNRPRSSADRRRQGGVMLVCGTLLFAASTLQQYGLLYTSVGKSGFITSLYIVLVPLLGILSGKKAAPLVWCGVALAVAGLYFLCVSGGLSFNPGDLLTLGCALLFSLHILFIDRYGARVDGVRLACGQFFVCSALSFVGMLLAETPSWAGILSCWLPIVYAGVFSGGVGYTLQILGQRDTEPAIASLLMSLESFFAALFGWLLLGQALTPRELFGCFLMLAAVVLAQLPDRRAAAQSLRR